MMKRQIDESEQNAMDVILEKTQALVFNWTTGMDVDEEHEDEEDVREKGEGKAAIKTTPMHKKRAPKNKFKHDKFICESKSLLTKNPMHEEPTSEDVAWLSSLSEDDLDMLMSIKAIASKRAKTIQHEHAQGVFSFRVLRTIGILLKEFIKEHLKNVHFPTNVTQTQNIQPERSADGIPIEKEGDCNDIKPDFKAKLEDMTTLETQNIQLEENDGKIPLEKVGKYNDVRPIVKAELMEMTTLETQNVLLDVNEGRLPSKEVGECKDIKPIVKAELAEMTTTNALKRKRYKVQA